MATATISLSSAKAQLSSIVKRVEDEDARFVIKKNNRPVAKIVPIAGAEVKSAYGALSAYANSGSADGESKAFAKAMEEKHAARR